MNPFYNVPVYMEKTVAFLYIPIANLPRKKSGKQSTYNSFKDNTTATGNKPNQGRKRPTQ